MRSGVPQGEDARKGSAGRGCLGWEGGGGEERRLEAPRMNGWEGASKEGGHSRSSSQRRRERPASRGDTGKGSRDGGAKGGAGPWFVTFARSER